MLKAKWAAAASLLFTMFSAHAIVQDCDEGMAGCPTGSTAPKATAVGPIYVFGTFNTKVTVLVLDTTGSKLCDVALTNCRPAYGLNALYSAKMMSAAQLVKWDRSGMFGINGYTLIACFLYYDSPAQAHFTCQTASASALTDDAVARDITSLAWRTYYASGLAPLSADRVNAFYAKRKRITTYAATYGTLPADKMKALETQDETVPPSGSGAPEAPQAEVDLELVQVIGSKPREDVVVTSPGVITIPAVQLTPPTTPNRPPEILLNPCVTFQVCSLPPPPPIVPPPPKICTANCNENANILDAACSDGGKAIGGVTAIVAPTGGIIVGVFADPILGYAFFKAVGGIGGGTAAIYTASCFMMNQAFRQRCLAIAKTNAC